MRSFSDAALSALTNAEQAASPYISEMIAAHANEVREMRELLDGVVKVASGVSLDRIRTPWAAEGRCVYDGPSAGDLVATFEDVRGNEICEQAVAAVNALAEIRRTLT